MFNNPLWKSFCCSDARSKNFSKTRRGPGRASSGEADLQAYVIANDPRYLYCTARLPSWGLGGSIAGWAISITVTWQLTAPLLPFVFWGLHLLMEQEIGICLMVFHPPSCLHLLLPLGDKCIFLALILTWIMLMKWLVLTSTCRPHFHISIVAFFVPIISEATQCTAGTRGTEAPREGSEQHDEHK